MFAAALLRLGLPLAGTQFPVRLGSPLTHAWCRCAALFPLQVTRPQSWGMVGLVCPLIPCPGADRHGPRTGVRVPARLTQRPWLDVRPAGFVGPALNSPGPAIGSRLARLQVRPLDPSYWSTLPRCCLAWRARDSRAPIPISGRPCPAGVFIPPARAFPTRRAGQ